MTDAQLWYEDLKTFSSLDHCIVEGLLKNKRWISFSFLNHQLIREGVKNTFFWDFVPNIGPHPPTAHVWDSTKWKMKVGFILLIGLFGAFYFFLKTIKCSKQPKKQNKLNFYFSLSGVPNGWGPMFGTKSQKTFFLTPSPITVYYRVMPSLSHVAA